MRGRNIKWLAGLIGLGILAAAAWYLGSPLLIDQQVDEAFPVELPSAQEIDAMPPEERARLEADAMATAAASPDKMMEETMPAEGQPETLVQGDFRGADAFHQGEGRATIYALADGSRILRFEDFMVTNGPGLVVLLSNASEPSDRASLGEEYVDLGSLKGNIGDQNYDIPDHVDLGQVQSVVIYCLPFHVVFASARLSP